MSGSLAEIARAAGPRPITAESIVQHPKDAEHSIAALAARRKDRVPLTPLNCNIPLDIDNGLRKCMEKTGLEKTAIVVTALRAALAEYL